jgi:hypothetical protein
MPTIMPMMILISAMIMIVEIVTVKVMGTSLIQPSSLSENPVSDGE